MAAGSFEECLFRFESDASEMDKIDKTIRLPGLNFPNGKRVIGRRDADLIVALGGFDISRNCTGNELLVVARLCILYEAILSTHKKFRHLDIHGDYFYEAALDYISERYPSIVKYLCTSNLRQVIEIYLLAFHRSGLKAPKPNADKSDVAQETGPAQHDAAQPDDNSSEAFIGENVMKTSVSAEYKGARIKLEKLVKEWMVIRAIARSKKATAEQLRTIALPYPDRQPGESNNTYILRLQKQCSDLREEKWMYEGESEREIKKYEELWEDYNELSNRYTGVLKHGYEIVKEKSDQQAQYIASIGQMQNTYNDQVDRMQDNIDRKNDEIDELKRRLGTDDDRWTHVYELHEQRGRFFRGGRGRPRGFAPSSDF